MVAVLLCRRSSLQTDFIVELAKSCIMFDIPHYTWTIEKNIDFIHSIARGHNKIKVAIRNDFMASDFENSLFKKRLIGMPLVKMALMECKDNEKFYNALLNELYNGVQTSASMLAIELNILIGFGFRISNIRTFDKGFVFEMQRRRRFLCM